MRSVYSVIRRSPVELIEEIILINDNSDDQDVITRIEQEIETKPELLNLVKFITPDQRLGLIRYKDFYFLLNTFYKDIIP